MEVMKYFFKLYEAIEKSNLDTKNYFVPSIWIDNESNSGLTKVNPRDFFIQSLERITHLSKTENKVFKTPENPLVYCSLIRYTTTFDHNRDSKISLEPLDYSLYETGTFLKAIAILPYLKKLGVDILYLLPVFEIGKYGRKGVLGSPYAYKHPFKLDSRLGEPFLNLSLEEQFKAFVEACHLCGIKVVLEFVFRTASIDSDLALQHPDWFYWIREEDLLSGYYQPPKFDDAETKQIIQLVEKKNFDKLIPPKKQYISMFTEVPVDVFRENERIVGILANGERVTIPYAFADWPPNDVQPFWTDVTYLRYFDHPNYNYIAYNTVRMYSKELLENGRKVQDLWNFLVEVIPYYIENFNIDGAMIDMGHAMPEELLYSIISTARHFKNDFIFWEENFNITEKSKLDGYNATLGYMFFDQHEPKKLQQIITKLENYEFSLPFFLAPETQNTPRSARFGKEYNSLVTVFNSFLPGIRFILSGFELFHNLPYNTGLCFTSEDISNFPPEMLPLYSPIEFNWVTENSVSFISQVNSIILNLGLTVQPFENYKIKLLGTTPSDSIVAFIRETNDFELFVFGNFSNNETKFAFENINEILSRSEILLGEFCFTSDNKMILQPYSYLVLKKIKQ
ncbi:MAG: alpha-amylase family glycosyl hydrolase [Candidatus Kapaibacteriota bacterium]